MSEAAKKSIFKQQRLACAREEIESLVFLARNSANLALVMILDFVNSLLTDIQHHIKPGEDFRREVPEARQRTFNAIVAGEADTAVQPVGRPPSR